MRVRRLLSWLRSILFLAVALALAWYFAVRDGEPTRGETVRVSDPATVHVIDGDTFHYGSEKIRLANVDAPEINPPHCEREAVLGLRAKARLGELLGAGPFEMAAAGRDTDQYGRKLRIVTRDGRSVGDVLVAEGLARRSENGRRAWC
jgi:endonuclease YncB( thermonuclease family)